MYFTLFLSIAICIPEAYGLQQIAGKFEASLSPGETTSFRWGLISDENEEPIEVQISAEGIGSEYLSFPKRVTLEPDKVHYVSVNMTIPSSYNGELFLSPRLFATELGERNGQVVINVRMQKTLAITIQGHSTLGNESKVNKFPNTLTISDKELQFDIESNSTVSEFAMDYAKKQISFKVSGTDGTRGFAIVPVGKALEGPYTVMIDGAIVSNFETIINSTDGLTEIKLEYSHSDHDITITGTNVIPEFPFPAIGGIVAALMISSIAVARLRKFL